MPHLLPPALCLRRYVPSDFDQVWWLHVEPLRATGAYLGGPFDDDLRDIEGVYLKSGEFLVGALADVPERLIRAARTTRRGRSA